MKQSAFDLGEPRQNSLSYPVQLWEKYEPKRLKDFIGIDDTLRIFRSLIKRPRPCSLLLHSPTGSGKTTLGMAFCRELPGSLIHIPAQQCDVARVDKLALDVMYGHKYKFWVVLVDEADQMTEKAQLQLLSRMDGSAKLKPTWSQGFVAGEAPPVMYIFTCNSKAGFEERFLGRCMQIDFDPVPQAVVAKYLSKIWRKENGRSGLPFEFFMDVAEGRGVRDALNQLDRELLRNPTIREVRTALARKAEKASPVLEEWENAAAAIEAVA